MFLNFKTYFAEKNAKNEKAITIPNKMSNNLRNSESIESLLFI